MDNKQPPPMPKPGQNPIANLPKEAQKKLKAIKAKLDKFKKQVVSKFDKYIVGIALLPPKKDATKEERDKINILVLVDDTDSKRMSKQELKTKLTQIIDNISKDIDKNIVPQTVILSELWQGCFDGKYEFLQTMAMAAPVYENGMLSAIKIAEIHKAMILKKFEKYIVSYVLAGSLVQGRATRTSDIDVWVVIDDTDVKKMTRAELKDKLRAIIIGMGIEAGDITGIKNKLNIQVYILTDFWDSLKEANPIIFTLLRDGVPFYDRGIFMPWKQLLKMGKIKPSPEAIDMFMNSGDQMVKRVKFKLKDIGMEDIYYAILTPSQAALMLYGVPPPSPRETAELMRDIFVKKEKLLEDSYVNILDNNIKTRKDIEHGTKKELTGKDVDKLLADAEKYLTRVKKLFKQIEDNREEDEVVKLYDTVVTIIRDVLRMEGIEKVSDIEVVKIFEDEMISQGKIPAKYLRSLNDIIKAKKDYDDKKLTKPEVEKVKKESRGFIKFMVEYIQRKRGRELERAKIRVKHGNRYGEILLLDKEAYIIHDIDHEEKEISKAAVKPNGGLGVPQKSSLEELEKSLAKIKIPPNTFIKEPIFEDLKRIFGKDVEVLIR
ncbi:MAG: nucleotidyltransferase domain-containing protein [archaeon]